MKEQAERLIQTAIHSRVPEGGLLATASEDITAYKVVNIFEDTNVVKVRKADKDIAERTAHGFIKDTVGSGQAVMVYTKGSLITSTPWLEVGKMYYLATDGNITIIVGAQAIGYAVTKTKLNFDLGAGMERYIERINVQSSLCPITIETSILYEPLDFVSNASWQQHPLDSAPPRS